MAWIFLATAGQFLNAVAAVMDKYIVSDEKALPRPFVYAFYTCLLTGSWVFIFLLGTVPAINALGIPSFGSVQAPDLTVVALSFLAAYTFFMALVSMYDALKFGDASNVIPVIGSVSAVSTFLLSWYFFSPTHSDGFIWGIAILAIGTLLVAQTLPKSDEVLRVFHSGLFFGLHFITMKGLFLETGFENGFFWSRISFVFFALSLLLIPAYFTKITKQTTSTSAGTGLFIVVAKVIAGIGSFLLLVATDWGDVAVVQALDGVKFVFILVITYLFGQMLPKSVVDKDSRPKEFFRKLLYVAVIVTGFFILFT